MHILLPVCLAAAQRTPWLEDHTVEGSEAVLSRSRGAKANIQSCLLKCLFYTILEKWTETMILNWIKRDYVCVWGGGIRCTECLRENSLETRVRFFVVIRLPPGCFPKLRAGSEISRHFGRRTKRNNSGEIEISWYRFWSSFTVNIFFFSASQIFLSFQGRECLCPWPFSSWDFTWEFK